MEEIFARMADNAYERVVGEMHVRIFLQPAMASFFGIRDGLRDAREGKVAYFWGLVTDAEHRGDMLKSGWHSIGKVFVIALVLDVVFQVLILKTIYPGGAIVAAFVLAILPYVVVRALTNRLARRG